MVWFLPLVANHIYQQKKNAHIIISGKIIGKFFLQRHCAYTDALASMQINKEMQYVQRDPKSLATTKKLCVNPLRKALRKCIFFFFFWMRCLAPWGVHHNDNLALEIIWVQKCEWKSRANPIDNNFLQSQNIWDRAVHLTAMHWVLCVFPFFHALFLFCFVHIPALPKNPLCQSTKKNMPTQRSYPSVPVLVPYSLHVCIVRYVYNICIYFMLHALILIRWPLISICLFSIESEQSPLGLVLVLVLVRVRPIVLPSIHSHSLYPCILHFLLFIFLHCSTPPLFFSA